MTIGIMDYGMGNLQSVHNALNFIGVDNVVSSDCRILKQADALILPGVGAFKDGMAGLKQAGMIELIQSANEKKTPILGICLGMQMMFDDSEEFGHHAGLGLLKGRIIKLQVPDLKIPHMGWNRLDILKPTPLLENLEKDPYVYFVHSYHLETTEAIVSATTFYGKAIQIAAQRDHLFALQFHPEKSGTVGLQILRNFANLTLRR